MVAVVARLLLPSRGSRRSEAAVVLVLARVPLAATVGVLPSSGRGHSVLPVVVGSSNSRQPLSLLQ